MTLVEQYEQCLPIWLHADGFPASPLLVLHDDNSTSMGSMLIPQEAIFSTVMAKYMTDVTVKEIVFGVDRYTKPGQGTKYRDVLTVFSWHSERFNEIYGWRFGVVNYRPPPNAIIEPIDWNNPFWMRIMSNIVRHHYTIIMEKITEIEAIPGNQETVNRLRQAVASARARKH